jgi:hypothetical protein
MSLVAESLANVAAKNHIGGLRLQEKLAIEERTSLFTADGKLTQEAINNAREIRLGELRNPKLLEDLSNQSGNLRDWRKYTTESFHTPSGNAQIHFYRNKVTGDVYYGRDYKTIFEHQGSWNLEPKPSFDYDLPRFNRP